jgi:hypothetical protein
VTNRTVDRGVAHDMASAAFATFPVPVGTVVVQGPSIDARPTYIFDRPGYLRDRAVAALFDEIEEQGALVSAINISGNGLTVQISNGPRVTVVPSSVQLESLDVGQIMVESESRPFGLIEGELFRDLEAGGFRVDAVNIGRERATVYMTPRRFREVARNIGRAGRIVANHAPASVEEIEIVSMQLGIEISRVTILRRDLENSLQNSGSLEEIYQHASFESGRQNLPPTAFVNPDRYPAFSWSISPLLRQHIGGGDIFYAYQVWLALSGEIELAPGLRLRARVGADVYNNFDELQVNSPSQLPKVRSDIKEYLQLGKNNLVRLQTDYTLQLAPELYGRISLGYFEEMYGGYGGEILYRPMGSRFATGIDLNWVRQRNFDQRLGFRDYTVATGHLNLYYDLPFYDLLVEANVGRYLAGDFGSTFTMSRRFDSGVRVGGFFTLTDVPFSLFGEGSFDKGIFIVLPLDLFALNSSRRSGSFGFRPLTKDGGQKLNISPRLYDLTGEGTLQEILRDWPRFLD